MVSITIIVIATAILLYIGYWVGFRTAELRRKEGVPLEISIPKLPSVHELQQAFPKL